MKKLLALLPLLFSHTVLADIHIFACEPEWASLSQELGGDKVTVFAATSALQDPHFIQARPSLIAKARRADLLVCTGAGLESGWLPLLQRKAGNSKIQTGSDGYFMATDYIHLKGVPAVLDRSQGHIHAAGNPHIQTNPVNIQKVAKALNDRLQRVDPQSAEFYQKNWVDFNAKWIESMQDWQQQAEALKGTAVVVQHDSWPYLFDWLGLEQVAVLESKPGVPPSLNDLNTIVNTLKNSPAKMVIHAAYQPARATDWLVSKTDINKVTLPFSVGGTDKSNDLFSLFDNTIQRLLDANK